MMLYIRRVAKHVAVEGTTYAEWDVCNRHASIVNTCEKVGKPAGVHSITPANSSKEPPQACMIRHDGKVVNISLQVVNGGYNHRIVKNTNFQTQCVPTIWFCKIFLSFPRCAWYHCNENDESSPKMKESYWMCGSDLDYDIVPCRNFFI
jgi:hypothetical protein